MADLLALTAELVDIPSVSHDEGAITELAPSASSHATPWLTVDQVGDNVVARTAARPSARLVHRRPHRHRARQRQRPAARRGRHAVGLGAADMKGGLAVMLELAAHGRPSPRST